MTTEELIAALRKSAHWWSPMAIGGLPSPDAQLMRQAADRLEQLAALRPVVDAADATVKELDSLFDQRPLTIYLPSAQTKRLEAVLQNLAKAVRALPPEWREGKP